MAGESLDQILQAAQTNADNKTREYLKLPCATISETCSCMLKKGLEKEGTESTSLFIHPRETLELIYLAQRVHSIFKKNINAKVRKYLDFPKETERGMGKLKQLPNIRILTLPNFLDYIQPLGRYYIQ